MSDFAVDSVVQGYVKHTDSKGCFVYLTRDIVARVLIKDVSAISTPVSQRERQMTMLFRPSEHGLAMLRAFQCNHIC